MPDLVTHHVGRRRGTRPDDNLPVAVGTRAGIPGRPAGRQRNPPQPSHVVELGDAALADVDRIHAGREQVLDLLRQLGEALDGVQRLRGRRLRALPLPAHQGLQAPAVLAAVGPLPAAPELVPGRRGCLRLALAGASAQAGASALAGRGPLGLTRPLVVSTGRGTTGDGLAGRGDVARLRPHRRAERPGPTRLAADAGTGATTGNDTARGDTTRSVTTRNGTFRSDTARSDTTRSDTARSVTTRSGTTRSDTARSDTAGCITTRGITPAPCYAPGPRGSARGARRDLPAVPAAALCPACGPAGRPAAGPWRAPRHRRPGRARPHARPGIVRQGIARPAPAVPGGCPPSPPKATQQPHPHVPVSLRRVPGRQGMPDPRDRHLW